MICPHCKNNTACEMPMSGLVCDTEGCTAYKAPSAQKARVRGILEVTLGGQVFETKGAARLRLGPGSSARLRLSPGMPLHSLGNALRSDYMARVYEARVRPILDALPPGPDAHDRAFDLFPKYDLDMFKDIDFIDQPYADIRKYRIHWIDGSFTFFTKDI